MPAGVPNPEDVELLLTLLRKNSALEVFREALTPEELEEFANRAQIRSFDQGQKIIRQGNTGSDFYIVLSGQLRAVDVNHQPPHLLNYHTTGEMIGMRALLDGSPRAATVEVVVNAKLAILGEEDWYWLIGKNSRFRTFFENLEERRAIRSSLSFQAASGMRW